MIINVSWATNQPIKIICEGSCDSAVMATVNSTYSYTYS